MKLIKLHLVNFKAARDVAINPNASNMSVYADNGIGKTTIADAFSWLLFGKDSQGRTMGDDIKTIDPETKEVIHSLEHSVEATLLLVGGKQVTLKKVFKEIWTKKRGSITSEFTGHTTDCFINGVPNSVGDFGKYIDGLCPESTFRVLTNPMHFNQVMKWQDRRAQLLKLAGDVSEADVIAANSELAPLTQILEGHTVEEYRKILANRRPEINREIQAIPVRINEARLAVKDVPTAKPNIELLKSNVEKAQAEKASLTNGSKLVELRAKKMEIEAQKLKIENDINSSIDTSLIRDAQLKLSELQVEESKAQNAVTTISNSISRVKTNLATLKAKRDEIKADLAKIDAEDFKVDSICPTCKQSISEDVIEEIRSKHNASQAAKRTALVNLGKQVCPASKIKEEEVALEDLEQQLESAKAVLSIASNAVGSFIMPTLDEAPKPEDSPKWKKLVKQIEEIVAEGRAVKESLNTAVAEADQKISTANDALAYALGIEQTRQANEVQLERIAELEAKEQELASAYESTEHHLYLLDLFIKTHCDMVTEKVNSMFQIVEFRLFETQINGGIAPCCVATVNGVPFDGGLNHAACVNAGLDIINTLSRAYGFTPPIIIDGAESVTKVLPTSGQQIRLVVSEADKVLRFEYEDKPTVSTTATEPSIVVEPSPQAGFDEFDEF
jgi:hypothetical protein